MSTLKPILYFLKICPPCRTVRLTANAIGLDLNIKPISLFDKEQMKPDFIEMNPIHTVPILNDNGKIIFDSHAICGYLCDTYAKNDELYPKDLVKRGRVNALLHFNSGYLFARLRFLYEPIIYNGSDYEPPETIKYIQKCWDIMELILKKSKYVCGDSMTIADFSCVTTITSINHIASIDSRQHPKLLEWIDRMKQSPDFNRINEDGAEEVQEIYVKKLRENQRRVQSVQHRVNA